MAKELKGTKPNKSRKLGGLRQTAHAASGFCWRLFYLDCILFPDLPLTG